MSNIVKNVPQGVAPDLPLSGRVYTAAARSRGDLVRLSYSSTYAGDGFNVAATADAAGAHNPGNCWGVCLADADAATWVQVCVRGQCPAKVEKSATNVSEDNTLIVGTGLGTADVAALTRASDIDQGDLSATNGVANDRKVVAISKGAETTGTVAIIEVIFNGMEGFGTQGGIVDITP